jgi:type I restriction enzyme, S subunit
MTRDATRTTVGELVDRGLAEIRTGPFGTQLRASDYGVDGTPVINVRNLGFGSVREAQIERAPAAVQQRLSGHLLQTGDIVFGRKGAVDRHALIARRQAGWMQGSDCIRMRLKAGSPVLPAFLSKALLTEEHKKWIEGQCSHGATMASLNQEIIRRIELDVPLISQQRRVVAVLAAFDGLIEINERRHEILERVVRSYFLRRVKGPAQLARKAAAVRGDGSGSLPAGWRSRSLGDIARLNYGKALPKPRRRPGGVSVVSSAGVIDTHDTALADGPGLIIGRKGNVGSVWWVDGEFYPIDTTYYAESDLPLEFLYWTLLDAEFVDSHAAVPGLNRDQALALEVLLPPAGVIDEIASLHRSAFRAASAYRKVADAARRTRGLLLSRLVTGRLDISDIDLGILTPTEAE